ncbi:sensor histidine kinase [Nannocystaceae bacterium ST9]
MKLRLRLVLTSLAVALPLIAGLYLIDARARHHAAEQMLAESTRMHMREPGERERCESAPRSWGGRPLAPPRDRGPHDHDRGPHDHDRPPPDHDERPGGAPPVLFAYAPDLRSANPDAPTIDPELAEAIADAELATFDPLWPGSSVDVLVRNPWAEGPCALIFAHGTTTAGWLGAVLPAKPIWLLPVLAMFVALLIAAGPVIRRIRKLATMVQRSAAAGFAEPVSLAGRDELAELSRAFDAAARAVRDQLAENQRRERALREFVANTTHDVMTPLTVLADRLITLDEQLLAGEPGDRAVLTAAMDEVHYLGSILSNLALAAKLDAGEPTSIRAPLELDALVERVVARHRTIARKLDIELASARADPPVSIEGDLTMLEQALGNLVHNAIRHNRPGGHVAVLVERPSPGRFRVRVIDDGPGIAPAELAKLIERGARGDDARTRDPSGQGLGLSIAYRVTELHGFTLALGAADEAGLRVDVEGPALA